MTRLFFFDIPVITEVKETSGIWRIKINQLNYYELEHSKKKKVMPSSSYKFNVSLRRSPADSMRWVHPGTVAPCQVTRAILRGVGRIQVIVTASSREGCAAWWQSIQCLLKLHPGGPMPVLCWMNSSFCDGGCVAESLAHPEATFVRLVWTCVRWKACTDVNLRTGIRVGGRVSESLVHPEAIFKRFARDLQGIFVDLSTVQGTVRPREADSPGDSEWANPPGRHFQVHYVSRRRYLCTARPARLTLEPCDLLRSLAVSAPR